MTIERAAVRHAAHRSAGLRMYRRTFISLIALANLGMASLGFAQQLDADQRNESEQNRWKAYQDRAGAETARSGTQHDYPDQTPTTYNFADRFINPHPELGCLYYDENNVRRWFRYCREP